MKLSILLLATLLVVAFCDFNCRKTINGATFDLAPLSTSQPLGYRVSDSRGLEYSRDFTYIFNVCDNVPQIPETENNMCTITTGAEGEQNSGKAPAFQIWNMQEGCNRLGVGDDMLWELVDSQNPSRGVQVTYGDGDSCHNGDYRKLTLRFLCEDDYYNIPDEEQVVEINHCHYQISIKTIYGCPLQCQMADRRLCGGNGFCDYDTDLVSPKCFCERGHFGASCTDEKSSNGDNSNILLVFIFIMLCGVVGACVVMWLKVKKLRLDPNAYYSLLALNGEPSGDLLQSTIGEKDEEALHKASFDEV
eukprot:TRINITY_DN4308_c0_g1_i1.p1 TRINITY_DN4308_c0_g1~~TRINITY_DN4308_c0_g1_i1.p1  ORF type:complete len:305 (+),score=85.64 TRINITY_DN4308_c0_g1_i1:35-949(+)